ncbi:MAG: cupredoxin domain-containing protein [Betaproteobacteria bacterium]|nr:cupredoxin domain-containing protein [Betaproteobacteria bacterium]NBY05350.1 cupredoxin domain-containing protein [Betaproteobacteria bacterium]
MNIPSAKSVAYGVSIAIAHLFAVCPAHASDLEMSLTIKNHAFEPSMVKVAANRRIKLTVQNLDGTPEEFESHALRREKLIPGGATAVIYIGPLKPGRYEFMGEFNPATAKGVVVAE